MNALQVSLLLSVILVCVTPQGAPPGIVDLDGFSFRKIVDGAHNVLVKFGEPYSYGEGAEQWESLAYQVLDKPDLVMAQVVLNTGMEDEYDMYGYGGMGSDANQENGVEQLFEQYRIALDALPQFLLFTKHGDPANPLRYNEERNGNVLSWIQSNGIYLGLQGCLAEFDELANEFIKYGNDATKRNAIGEAAKKEMDKYDKDGSAANEEKHKSAKYYIKVMAKIVSNNHEWVSAEIERLSKILMSGNLSTTKQKWFEQRLNILSVFASAINPSQNKSEL